MALDLKAESVSLLRSSSSQEITDLCMFVMLLSESAQPRDCEHRAILASA